jgi:flagellar hook-associated protein 2
MGSITSAGIGSGIDLEAIITALVDAERAPKQLSLDRRELTAQTTLSSISNLSSALSEVDSAIRNLNNLSDFQNRTADSSDEEFATITASSTATDASFDVQVVKLASATTTRSDFAAAETSTVVGGAGTLTFDAGSDSFSVTIDATDTYADIRSKINDHSSNFGVTANIINYDGGITFDISSSKTGLANDLSVVASDASMTAFDNQTGTMTNYGAGAVDAEIIINSGNTIKSETNKFVDAVVGTTITAEKITTSDVTMTVSKNTSGVSANIAGFVTTMNSLFDIVDQLTDVTDSGSGSLTGDAMVRQLESQVRNTMGSSGSANTSTINSMAELGITTDRQGKLVFDSTQLDKVMDASFDDIGTFFAGTDGVATRLETLLGNYTGSAGIIPSRQTSINEQLDKIGEERLDLADRIEKLETRLRAQYGAMDILVAQFNNTGNFLTQQLNNLPGFTKKSS